jgi:hypothetical protein
MYQHLLWNLATALTSVAATQQGAQRRSSLRDAGELYERCALLSAPTLEEDRQQGAILSEPALRQSLQVYRDLDNLALVRHAYGHYLKTMQRRFRGWKPEPPAAPVFRETTDALEQGR